MDSLGLIERIMGGHSFSSQYSTGNVRDIRSPQDAIEDNALGWIHIAERQVDVASRIV